ncbi:YphA family membrane protein [Paenibacillus glycinis]|uniref:Permease n=1 Tax=Paenibacillus glycinis TaxID=2697035 RepID=A0ABW9XJF8_9BACL|nr:hypothetical protein [Paenibacillus glycinis]NBD22604.1 hypothetical protein [Paenibacillus glycinis]
MNDGFIVFWLLSMAAILYFTGWEEQVADGIRLRTIGVFIGASCLLQLVSINIRGEAVVTGSAVLAIVTAVTLLITVRRLGTMLFVLFSSLLTGFMWTWMRYIYSMDPVFVVIHPHWDGPVLAGLFAGLLADRFRSHFTIVVLSALLALAYHFIGTAAQDSPLEIGSLAWWDGLAIALTAARVVGSIKAWIKQITFGMIDNQSGERGGNS